MYQVVVIEKPPVPRGPFLVGRPWFAHHMIPPFKKSFISLEPLSIHGGDIWVEFPKELIVKYLKVLKAWVG